MSSRRRISPAAGTPTQPGRIADEPTMPSLLADRPGQAHSGADHLAASRRRPRPAAPSTSRRRRRGPPAAAWSVSSGTPRSARIREERSETATRRWLWPKSMPTAAPADASNESRIGGRPPCVAVRGAVLRALDHEAVGLQVGDEAGDGRAGQPGTARDLGARDQALVAQRVDHAQAVEAPERFERPSSTRSHAPRIRSDRRVVCQGLERTNRYLAPKHAFVCLACRINQSAESRYDSARKSIAPDRGPGNPVRNPELTRSGRDARDDRDATGSRRPGRRSFRTRPSPKTCRLRSALAVEPRTTAASRPGRTDRSETTPWHARRSLGFHASAPIAS